MEQKYSPELFQSVFGPYRRKRMILLFIMILIEVFLIRIIRTESLFTPNSITQFILIWLCVFICILCIFIPASQLIVEKSVAKRSSLIYANENLRYIRPLSGEGSVTNYMVTYRCYTIKRITSVKITSTYITVFGSIQRSDTGVGNSKNKHVLYAKIPRYFDNLDRIIYNMRRTNGN